MAGRGWIGIAAVAAVAAVVGWYGVLTYRSRQAAPPAALTQTDAPASPQPQPPQPPAAKPADTQPAPPTTPSAQSAANQEAAKPAGTGPVETKPADAGNGTGPAAPAAPQLPAANSANPDSAKPDSAKPDSTNPTPAGVGQPAAAKPQQQASAGPAQAPAAAAPPTPAAGQQPPAKVRLPTFDIVRVEPTGDTVVAGQGMPGATVELLRNGAPFARAVADVGGQWAIVPPPLPKGAGELSLRVTTPDGRTAMSEQVVAVQVPEKQGDPVLVVLNTPNAPSKVLNDGAGKVLAQVPASSSPANPAPAKPTPESSPTSPTPGKPGPAKPAAVAAGQKPQPQTLAQASPAATPAASPSNTAPAAAGAATPAVPTPTVPAPAAPGAAEPAKVQAAQAEVKPAPPRANAEIKTVEADEAGKLFVTGTAQPGASIQIYLNDTPLAKVTAAADGTFGMTVEKGVTPGNYRVRVDDVDAASGKVLTRAEVPFAMAAPAKQPAPAAVVTAANEPAPAPTMRDIGVPLPAGPKPAGQPAGQPVTPPAAGDAVAVPSASPPPAAAPAAEAPAKSDAAPPAAPTPVAEAAPAPADPTKPGSVAVVPEVKTVTIIRGDNLWRISRKSYGRGIRYTWIYDANTDQIRDPNRIYPGQIFVMPDRKEQDGK